MRRVTRRLLIVAAGLLLAACGPDGGEAPEDQAAPAQGEHAMMAEGDHAGMRMEGVGEPADAVDADRTIEVATLDSMAYDPPTISVEPGETVTFVVSNPGEAVHEFTLGDQAMQDQHADEMAGMGSGMVHDDPNSVSLRPGETKQLTWQFGDAGTVIYACHEPGHYQAGMRGEITVG